MKWTILVTEKWSLLFIKIIPFYSAHRPLCILIMKSDNEFRTSFYWNFDTFFKSFILSLFLFASTSSLKLWKIIPLSYSRQKFHHWIFLDSVNISTLMSYFPSSKQVSSTIDCTKLHPLDKNRVPISTPKENAIFLKGVPLNDFKNFLPSTQFRSQLLVIRKTDDYIETLLSQSSLFDRSHNTNQVTEIENFYMVPISFSRMKWEVKKHLLRLLQLLKKIHQKVVQKTCEPVSSKSPKGQKFQWKCIFNF